MSTYDKLIEDKPARERATEFRALAGELRRMYDPMDNAIIGFVAFLEGMATVFDALANAEEHAQEEAK